MAAIGCGLLTGCGGSDGAPAEAQGTAAPTAAATVVRASVPAGCCGDSEVDAAVESASQALQNAPELVALPIGDEELARAIVAAARLEALLAGRVRRGVEP